MRERDQVSQNPLYNECHDNMLMQCFRTVEAASIRDVAENFLTSFHTLRDTYLEELEGTTEPNCRMIADCLKDMTPGSLAERARAKIREMKAKQEQPEIIRQWDMLAIIAKASMTVASGVYVNAN